MKRFNLLAFVLGLVIGSPIYAETESVHTVRPVGWVVDESAEPCHNEECVPEECDQACEGGEIFTPNMIGSGLMNAPRPTLQLSPAALAIIYFPNEVINVADNNSPLPRDRAAFSYNGYDDYIAAQSLIANGAAQDIDIHSYKFIYERTVMNGSASFQVIIPFSYTMSSDQTGANFLNRDTEIGNVAVAAKVLLVERQNLAVSAGLQVELPTGNDRIGGIGPIGPIQLDLLYTSEDFYFTPYLAALYAPSDKAFVQSFMGYRFGTEDNELRSLLLQGQRREPDFIFANVGAGYWLMQNSQGRIRGLAPTVELHYQHTTEGVDGLFGELLFNQTDQLSLTTGVTALINDNMTAALAAGIPLRNNSGDLPIRPTDRNFDYQVMLQLNMFLGN